jgi:hypothetical protein
MTLLSLLRTPTHAACTCRHAEDTHEHYRRGSDCGIAACSCLRYCAQLSPAAVPARASAA